MNKEKVNNSKKMNKCQKIKWRLTNSARMMGSKVIKKVNSMKRCLKGILTKMKIWKMNSKKSKKTRRNKTKKSSKKPSMKSVKTTATTPKNKIFRADNEAEEAETKAEIRAEIPTRAVKSTNQMVKADANDDF